MVDGRLQKPTYVTNAGFLPTTNLENCATPSSEIHHIMPAAALQVVCNLIANLNLEISP
jgi:hypothetical protein